MMDEKSMRLHPKVFKVAIDRIRMGYYSDKYFTRYVEVLKRIITIPWYTISFSQEKMQLSVV